MLEFPILVHRKDERGFNHKIQREREREKEREREYQKRERVGFQLLGPDY